MRKEKLNDTTRKQIKKSRLGYSLHQLTQLVFFLKRVKDKEGEKEGAEERRRGNVFDPIISSYLSL